MQQFNCIHLLKMRLQDWSRENYRPWWKLKKYRLYYHVQLQPYELSWSVRGKILTVKWNHMVLNDWQVFTTCTSETRMLQGRVRVQICLLEAVLHWLLLSLHRFLYQTNVPNHDGTESLLPNFFSYNSQRSSLNFSPYKTPDRHHFSSWSCLLLGARTQEDPGRWCSSMIIMYYLTSGSS